MVITHKVKIKHRLGLHLRVAAVLVQTSSKFKCQILVKHGHSHVNGKSLINLITLAAGHGTELTFVFEGEDAREAQIAIHNLFHNNFGDKE